MILDPTSEGIETATRLLKSGQLVAFPTETVYGLGANATDSVAVEKIFSVKGRPSNNPLIVHIASLDQITQVADITLQQEKYLTTLSPLWPGPLSIVLPRKNSIVAEVAAGGSTIAVRIPNHPIALKLIENCGFALAAPSANPSGYISPTRAAHVASLIGNKIGAILDGGPCSVGIESTVLSLIDKDPSILRSGAITQDVLEATLGTKVNLRFSADPSGPLLSPGMLSSHYAPKTPLLLAKDYSADMSKSFILIKMRAGKSELDSLAERVITLSENGELAEIARNLYAALYDADNANINYILIDEPPLSGFGIAITDRISRALIK